MGHRRRCSCCCEYFLDHFERDELDDGSFEGMWTGDDWEIEEHDGSRMLVAKSEGAEITCEKEHPGGSTNVVVAFRCLLPIDCAIKVSIGSASAEFVQSSQYGQNGRVKLYDGETLLKDEPWDTPQNPKPVKVRVCVANEKIFAGGSWAEVTQPDTSKARITATAIAEEATVSIDDFTLSWHSSDKDGCPSCSTYPKPQCPDIEGAVPICLTVSLQTAINPLVDQRHIHWCNCPLEAKLVSYDGKCAWWGTRGAHPYDSGYAFHYDIRYFIDTYTVYNEEGLPEDAYRLVLMFGHAVRYYTPGGYQVGVHWILDWVDAHYQKDLGTQKPTIDDLYSELTLVSQNPNQKCTWPSTASVAPSDLMGEECGHTWLVSPDKEDPVNIWQSIDVEHCPCRGVMAVVAELSGFNDVPIYRLDDDPFPEYISNQSQINGTYFITNPLPRFRGGACHFDSGIGGNIFNWSSPEPLPYQSCNNFTGECHEVLRLDDLDHPSNAYLSISASLYTTTAPYRMHAGVLFGFCYYWLTTFAMARFISDPLPEHVNICEVGPIQFYPYDSGYPELPPKIPEDIGGELTLTFLPWE